jgi:hypothetical protein
MGICALINVAGLRATYDVSWGMTVIDKYHHISMFQQILKFILRK